jgi:DNA-binding NarL/FixJ family response regulator
VPLRVVFAEDNYLVREGTTALLSTAPDVEVVASVSDSRDLLRTVAEMAPDAVLTDIRMPPTFTTEGIDAARRIRAEHPRIGVLVLSQHADGAYATELLGGGAAGLGYLLKERVADVSELVRALTEVAHGGSVLDPKVVEVLLAATARERSSPLGALTSRETDVLREMATGRNNAGIAKALYLSERAVEKHINAVFAKLGLAEEKESHRRVRAVLTFLNAGP